MSPRPTIPDRRRAILDAAEAMILASGFEAMTMQRLAQQVGISKGGLYREFASKEDLLDALLGEAVTRLIAASAVVGADGEPPSLSERYLAAARCLLHEPLLCAAFLDDDGILGAQVARVGDGRYRDRHRLVQSWVAELQEAGRLRTDLDAAAVALALSSATLGLLSAAKVIGPLSRDQLFGALDVLAAMTRALDSPPSA